MKRLLLASLLFPCTQMIALAHDGNMSAGAHPDPPVRGIIAGMLMFLILESAVIYLTFKPWFHNPNLPASPSPEKYFHAAIYSFGAMVITGGILTRYFSGVNLANTPLMSVYGYNNVCVVFDSPPSTYICPVYWFFVAYLIVRYAAEDTQRLVLLTGIGTATKALAYGINVALVVVAAFFSLCLAIRPELDMKGHTLPFVALVLTLPLVFLMPCIQCRDRSKLYLLGVGVYMGLSFTKAVFDIYALTGRDHVPPGIAQTIDVLWLICAVSTPFVVPVPDVRRSFSVALT